MGEVNRFRLEQLTKKFRISAIITVLSAIALVFSCLYPQGEEVFTQHMGPDGPGIIEYRMQYTPFEEFLLNIWPWCFLVLVVAAICTLVLFLKIRKLKNN